MTENRLRRIIKTLFTDVPAGEIHVVALVFQRYERTSVAMINHIVAIYLDNGLNKNHAYTQVRVT